MERPKEHAREDGETTCGGKIPNSGEQCAPILAQGEAEWIVRDEASGCLPDEQLYLRTIFNFVQAGLVVIDADTHRIVDVNPSAVGMIGAPRSTIIGAVCHKFICPADLGKCPITDFGQKVDRSERVLLMADGSKRPIIKSVSPIVVNNHRYLLESFLDITSLKAAEEEIRKKTEELARSNLELQQFAHIASHDLQEPLRAISGFTELLQKRYEGKLDEKADKYIGFIVEGSLRMQQMIQDLLNYSRVQTQGREFTCSKSQEAFDRAIANLRVLIQENNAVITSYPLPEVYADTDQISLVFQNLIGNAIKYHTPGLAPIVHVSAREEGDLQEFSVRDNGIGFDEKYSDRLFKLFQRLHTRSEYPGTGIGLAVCKRIVERHNGTIRANSAPGKGTTFYFTLPVQRSKKA